MYKMYGFAATYDILGVLIRRDYAICHICRHICRHIYAIYVDTSARASFALTNIELNVNVREMREFIIYLYSKQNEINWILLYRLELNWTTTCCYGCPNISTIRTRIVRKGGFEVLVLSKSILVYFCPFVVGQEPARVGWIVYYLNCMMYH